MGIGSGKRVKPSEEETRMPEWWEGGPAVAYTQRPDTGAEGSSPRSRTSTDSSSTVQSKEAVSPTRAAPMTRKKGLGMTLSPQTILQHSPPETSYGFRQCCEAIRDAVPLEEVARRYTNSSRSAVRHGLRDGAPCQIMKTRRPASTSIRRGVVVLWLWARWRRGGPGVLLRRLRRTLGSDDISCRRYGVEFRGRSAGTRHKSGE